MLRYTLIRSSARTVRNVRWSSFEAFKKDKVASKKEEDTFAEVFNKIMNRSSSKATHHDSQSALLFEQTFNQIEQNKEERSPWALLSPRLVNAGRKGGPSPLVETALKKKHAMTQTEELQRSERLHESLSETIRGLDAMELDLQLYEFMEPLILRLDARLSRDSYTAFNDELLKKIAQKSEISPLAPLCNEFTVPLLLIKVIKTLHEKFHSPDLAMTLFEMSKQQSLKTYVYVCVIGVYNQVLKMHWDSYKSISRINSLINDMKVNGIQGNNDTIQIIRSISQDAHMMLHEHGSIMLDLETGPSVWAPMWNKSDEEELRSVDNYVADLLLYFQK